MRFLQITLTGLLLGLGVASASWATGGEGETAAETAAGQRGILRVAFATFGRETFDPGSDSGVSQQQFMNQIYDQLLDFAPDGSIGPGLAEAWSISPDGTLYTFKIRDDAEFHGGFGKVTPDDIRFSLIRRSGGPLGGSGAFRQLVEEITVVDENTLTIRLNKPAVSFLYELAPHQSTNSMTLSKDYLLADVGEMELNDLSDEAFEAEIGRQSRIVNERPIGSGPYAFKSRVLGDSVNFTAVESHWRNTPAFAELQFILVPEVATQVALIKSGAVDMIQVDADGAADLRSDDIPIKSIPASTAVGWMFTGVARDVAKDEPIANRRVRYALNLAIDRQELLDVFAGGFGSLPDAPFSMNAATADVDPAFWKNWYAETLPYDPERAKQILAEEGYPEGFSGFTAHAFPRGNAPWLPQLIEAVVGGWAEIGVHAEVVPIDYGAYRPHLVNPDDNDPFNAGDAAGMATNMQFDPPRSMFVWFESTGPLRMFLDNDTRFDELWAKVDTTFDKAERTRLVQEASMIALEQWVVTPLFNTDTLWALNPETIDASSWTAVTGYPYLARVYETIRPR